MGRRRSATFCASSAAGRSCRCDSSLTRRGSRTPTSARSNEACADPPPRCSSSSPRPCVSPQRRCTSERGSSTRRTARSVPCCWRCAPTRVCLSVRSKCCSTSTNPSGGRPTARRRPDRHRSRTSPERNHMPINTTLDKTRRDLERTLADVDKTPLYAVVGVTDLAVEKIRVARAELRSRVSHLDAKAFRDQAQTAVAQRIAAVQSDVTAVPEQAKALPVRAQAALGEAIGTALTAYGDLAGRGKTLVNRVRRQQSTADLTDQAKSTAARA